MGIESTKLSLGRQLATQCSINGKTHTGEPVESDKPGRTVPEQDPGMMTASKLEAQHFDQLREHEVEGRIALTGVASQGRTALETRIQQLLTEITRERLEHCIEELATLYLAEPTGSLSLKEFRTALMDQFDLANPRLPRDAFEMAIGAVEARILLRSRVDILHRNFPAPGSDR